MIRCENVIKWIRVTVLSFIADGIKSEINIFTGGRTFLEQHQKKK